MFQEFTGLQYLQIDIANNYGLDKKKWDERIDWFKNHEDKLDLLLKTAENPALFFAGVQAYRKALKGEPSGYPVSLDGTSSGLQILACLMGDREAAALCNVIDTGEREDAYTTIYQTMMEHLGENSKISRDDVKDAIMTSLYGSEAVPKRVFGEGDLLQVFFAAMEVMAPGAWDLNRAFLSMWDPTATSYSWVLPDNFHVHTKVKARMEDSVHFMRQPIKVSYEVNQATKEGRSLGANTTHSIDAYIVRELVRRCSFDPEQLIQVKVALCSSNKEPSEIDPERETMVKTLWAMYEKTGMLSARIFDYLDEDTVTLISDRQVVWKLIYSLPRKPFQVLTVHDCFRVLPNYGNCLRKQYVNLLVELAKSNLLNHIVSSIMGKEIVIDKLNPDMWAEVQFANYALS